MLSSSFRQREKRFLKGVAENPGPGSGSFYDQMSVLCLSISQRAGFYERVIIGVIYWAPTACKALYIYYLCAFRGRASPTIALISVLSPLLCVANWLMPSSPLDPHLHVDGILLIFVPHCRPNTYTGLDVTGHRISVLEKKDPSQIKRGMALELRNGENGMVGGSLAEIGMRPKHVHIPFQHPASSECVWMLRLRWS